jgi:hypothetical protein
METHDLAGKETVHFAAAMLHFHFRMTKQPLAPARNAHLQLPSLTSSSSRTKTINIACRVTSPSPHSFANISY